MRHLPVDFVEFVCSFAI